MNAGAELLLEHLQAAGLEMAPDGDESWKGSPDGACPACDRPGDRVQVRVDASERAWVNCRTATCGTDAILETLGLRLRDVRRVETDGEEYRPRLRVLDLHRMMAETPPPVAWAVDGWVPRACLTMLSGREGLGKSLLAYAVGASASRGGGAVGGLELTGARVVYIDAENGEPEIWRRVHRLGAEPGRFIPVDATGFSLRSGMQELDDLIHAQQAELVILDSLRRIAPGVNENDSQEMDELLQPLSGLAHQTDIAIVVLHHSPRGSDGTYRGSSAIGAVVDTGIALRRHDEDSLKQIRRQLWCWKMRPASEPAPRWFTIEPSDKGVSLEESAAFDKRQAKRDEQREDLHYALTDEPQSQVELAEASDVPRSTVQRLLPELEAEGRAQRHENGWTRVPQGPPPADPAWAPSNQDEDGSRKPNPPSGNGDGGGAQFEETLGPNWAGHPPEKIVVDLETTGLDAREDEITRVGFTADGHTFAKFASDERERIQTWLSHDALYVAHGARTEVGFLREAGYQLPARWEDTITVAHTAGERGKGGRDLKTLTKQLIEAGELPEDTLAPEAAVNEWLKEARKAARKEDRRSPQKGDAPLRILDPYLEADLRCTWAVHEHFSAGLNGQLPVLELERRVLPAVLAVERRGVPFDLDAGLALRERSERRLQELEERLFELAGRKFVLGSARQIEEILIARGVDVSAMPRTPGTGVMMTAARAMEALDDEFARLWLEHGAALKELGYVRGLWKHTRGDRLYGRFNPCGARTGRMSSSKPNLQQIPVRKGKLAVRYCIAAGPGKTLVGADQDQVELRVLAHFAAGGRLEQALAAGVDVHAETGARYDLERADAKQLLFAVAYGSGPDRIAETLKCEGERAALMRNGVRRTYPELRELMERLMDEYRRRGFIRSAGGRHHTVPEGKEYQVFNRMVQGSCADLFKRAVAELHERGVAIVLLVHDEIVVEAAESDRAETARVLEDALSREVWGIAGLCAEAAAHKRWSDFKQPGYTP